MLNTLRKIRNEIINKGDMGVYHDFVAFLQEPTEKLNQRIIENTAEYENDIEWTLSELFRVNMTKKTLYREKILHGQIIIWKEIFECVERITRNQKLIEKSECPDFKGNYIKTNTSIKNIISFYVDSQVSVSKLEEHLGIDRYLDRIAEVELSAINEMINQQRKLVEQKIEPVIHYFENDWSNVNIPNVVYHKLYKYDEGNQLCTLTWTNQKNVILFVVDGLGWCQYQWHKMVCKEDGNYAYKESVFDWLEQTGNSKEMILGTPLITDTAAGLSQIYTGKKGAVTGVFASKFKAGGRIFDTKKLSVADMEKYFNTHINCMTSILDTMGIKSEIMYCTKYDDRNHGFADYLYGYSEIKPVLPSERVYNVLLNKIGKGDLKPFSSVYMTTIDNTGHTMGAFSKLEKYEHKKMDFLFKNFLLELAEKHPDTFDGGTSILFVADHGMAETSCRMIYRKEIENVLKDYGDLWIVINNRSCFIYGLYEPELKDAKALLQKFFEQRNIEAKVIAKKESAKMSNLPGIGHKSRMLVPDMIISLVDNALFYHSNKIEEELFHFAGHGGASVNEKLVPLIEINLTEKLLDDINDRFIDMM